MDKALLEEIGLTKSEINVYLALLELGSSSTGKIVEKSKASSSKIYEILEKLMEKGLVSYVIKSGVKYFNAASPKRILDYMQEKQALLKNQTAEVEKLLPELELKQTLTTEKSETLVFKGMKGAETAFEDILTTLKKNEEVLILGFSEVQESFQNFLLKFHKKRAKLGIKLRGVYGTNLREMGNKIAELPYSKIKFFQSQEGNPVAILVYKDKTLFSLAWDLIWIQIKNQRLADSFRTRFEEIWEQKVQSFEGQSGVESAYNALIETVKKNDEVVVFAAKPTAKEGADFNLGWTEKIRQKVKSFRLLYYGYTEKNIERAKEFERRNCQTKIIPTEQTLPISTVVAGDTVLNSVWDKIPLAFNIRNKTVADSFRANFDLLWGQDVKVYKGFEAVTKRFSVIIDELKEGDEYYILGSSSASGELKLENFFMNFHKKRIPQKIKVKLLCIPESYNYVHKVFTQTGDPEMRYSELKRLPPEFKSPIQITLYGGNKILMIVWSTPVCFEIESEPLYHNFKTYFDTLWHQEVITAQGIGGVKSAWDKMLDELAPGEEYYVMGAADRGKKEINDYLIDFHRRRQAKRVKVKFLFTSGAESFVEKFKDNYIPLSEVRFLPQGVYPGIQFNFFKNKILIIVWREKEPIVFSIEDEKVYHTFKTYFDTMWKISER